MANYLLKKIAHFKISSICNKYDIRNYTINSDNSIDVDGTVDISYRKLKKIPLKFNRVTGSFFCNGNELTSLEGCPRYVGGNFSCDSNKLISLKYSPDEIVGGIYFSNNNLTNLIGAPKNYRQYPYPLVGDISMFTNNPLPIEIVKNIKYINFIIKRWIFK